MGMAASQARFLGLTARKNNVEFEGQQINQQRTTLSNQSANYYNNLLGMSVPVPPSVDDYTKTVYTFQDGALTNQVTAMISQPNGQYTISYLRTWNDDFSVVGAATSIVNRSTVNGETVYKVGADELRTLGAIEDADFETLFTYNGKALTNTGNKESFKDTDEDAIIYTYEDDQGVTHNLYYFKEAGVWYEDDKDDPDSVNLLAGTVPVENEEYSNYKGSDAYLKTLSQEQLNQLMKEEQQYITLLQNKYGQGEYMVRYVQNTTTGEWSPYFYKKSDLENAIVDDNGNSQSNINCYKIGSETKTEEVKAVKGCEIEKDSSGRYINITIPSEYDENGNPVQQSKVTYALTTETATDQAAYEDAMNQYEYEKYEYDQAIQEINAKIEIVQAEDKDLELRLKQLDTEQRAISTEIEAVSQVIQKNTESSFKTFG